MGCQCVIFNGLLQFIIYTMEKNTTLLTNPLPSKEEQKSNGGEGQIHLFSAHIKESQFSRRTCHQHLLDERVSESREEQKSNGGKGQIHLISSQNKENRSSRRTCHQHTLDERVSEVFFSRRYVENLDSNNLEMVFCVIIIGIALVARFYSMKFAFLIIGIFLYVSFEGLLQCIQFIKYTKEKILTNPLPYVSFKGLLQCIQFIKYTKEKILTNPLPSREEQKSNGGEGQIHLFSVRTKESQSFRCTCDQHLLDERTSEVVFSRRYMENTNSRNLQMVLGCLVIGTALADQFYPKKFPENKHFLIVCIVLHVIFNGLLQFIIYTNEKDSTPNPLRRQFWGRVFSQMMQRN